MLVAQAELDAACSAHVLMIWDCNGVEILWRGRTTVCYRGTVCSQWEFLNAAENVNCMSLWAAMNWWDYSALVYLSFTTPWNSMVHHAVTTGLYADHLFWFLKSSWLPYTNTTSLCAVVYMDWPHIHAWTHCAWMINWDFTKCTVPSAEPWSFSCNNDSKLCIWLRSEYRQGILSR
jgi:hypothetical protein